MPYRIPISVVSQEVAEQADYVVCARKAEFDPTIFPDNLEAPCCDCGEVVVFRPHAPKAPPKVCIRCAVARAEAERNSDG